MIRTRKYAFVLPYAVLLVPVVVLFGGTLLAPGPWVASHTYYDVPGYYAPVRSFGFGEIRAGHVPQWNPYSFSGTPFVAGFQSALYYPLNLHYLVLPLSWSLNIEIVLHFYLLGVFTYLWGKGRGLSALASLLAAVTVQCSGPYFLNIFAGHLSYIAALAWSPLVFLAVDKAVYKVRLPWAFVGAMALTMSILAGHPQAVFCVVTMLAPYGLIGIAQSPRRARSTMHLALLLVLPPLLSAPQLWPAVALSGEGIRAGGLPYVLASSLSFPPENLFTLLAPAYLGDSVLVPYTGRWVFWETCGFMGIGALSLAGYAAIAGEPRERFVWLGLALLAAVLALGRYTPVYGWMYAALPGVASFRCPSRFFFHAVQFLALLTGLGWDTLMRRPVRARRMAAGMVVACVALAACAGYLLAADAGEPPAVWSRVLAALHVPGEARWEMDAINVTAASVRAALSFGIAAGMCAAIAPLYALAAKYRHAAGVMLTICACELLVFALGYRTSFDLASRNRPALAAELHARQPDARVFDMAVENFPLANRCADMWGYDSTALLRYAQLIAYTQGTRAEYELTEFQFRWFHPVYAMLRCQYIVDSRKEADAVIQRFDAPCPRAYLVTDYAVVPDFESRLALVSDTSFDPRRRVVLEREPEPKPSAAGTFGTVTVHDVTTDRLLIDVDAPSNAVLVVTDAYATGWRATPAAPGPQAHYAVLPANHVLRAIPLAAGRHRIQMEYAPPAARWGMAMGTAACACSAAGVLWTLRRRPAT